MRRMVLVYGTISGLVIIGTMILGMELAADDSSILHSEYLGYLIMLVALSVIFVAIRQYRDRNLDGAITFGKALLIGLGISAVAGVIYVVIWEIYLAATDQAYIDDYVASVVAAKQSAGASAAELAAVKSDMAALREQYANPLFRLPMTFLEIFPVGLVVSLVSAAVLSRHRRAAEAPL